MTTLLTTPAGWPRMLVARFGAADPTDLDAATRAGAFAGLKQVINNLGQTGVTALIASANLRGRGGAGYPAAEKWRVAAAQDADVKYVVANGYGADPAAFTDRSLMEEDPYAVIEGLAITAYAVGASQAYIAVRAEYGAAIRRLESAVAQAEEAGFVGEDVLGSGHDIFVTVRPVQGAYMLGEETVLLKALEGKRGQPEQRPPYPAQKGLFGRPTVVHNVQTLALVPWIAINGQERFAAAGSPMTPGTVLVQLRGSAGEGIAEVPFGTPLRELIALVGGAGKRHQLRAVLVGGPSGGLLPPETLDVAYDFESLRDAGAHVGSGSVVVADERACVVDLARLLTRFCADEACGKTIPCRIGTRRLFEIGDRMTSGRPRPTDLQLLADLSHDVVESALCDHERLTTLPLASGMRYFRSELDDHILRSSCSAGVCHPIVLAAAGGAH